MKIKSRLKHYILLGLIVASTLTATLSPIVSALIPVDPTDPIVKSMGPTELATSWQFYNALSYCMKNSLVPTMNFIGYHDTLTESDAKSGKWFYNGPGSSYQARIGYFLADTGLKTNGSGLVECGGDNSNWIPAAATLWGYSDTLSLLCDSGVNRKDHSPCHDGSGDFEGLTNRSQLDFATFQAKVGAKVYGSGTAPSALTQPSFYPLYQKPFFSACLGGATPTAYSGPAAGEFDYTVTTVNMTDGSKSTVRYLGVKSKSTRIDYALNAGNLSTASKTCQELAQETSNFANAYYTYLQANPDELAKQNIILSKSTATTAGSTSSCAVDGVGWIVCSVANFVAKVSDGIYSLIESMLVVPAINTDTASGTNGVYNAWTIMRNLANIAFVIAFLIIIFSQLTSVGITNYGIKKTLPRLVVSAILVNLSFWIAAIAVDASNIAGASIYSLLSGVKDSMHVGLTNGSNWTAIIGALLGGAGIAVSGVAVAAVAGAAVISGGMGLTLLYFALPLLLTAVLAVFVAAFVLIARQALIIILLIVSPLAFVALLLPNTNKLFTKWRQMLTSLLLMYPIISILFGGAQIAGLAIISTVASITPNLVASPAEVLSTGLTILTGQIVMVAPFFFLPTMITKFSGGNIDGLAAKLSNSGKGLIGRASKYSSALGKKEMGRGFERLKYNGLQPSARLNKKGNETLFSKIGRFGAGSASQAGTRYDQYNASKALADQTLGDNKQEAIRRRLGTDKNFATASAGGNATAGEVVASRAIAAAEAEELKKALQPLLRELAGMDPSLKKEHLNDEIKAGGARRQAALQFSASIGDTKFIRDQIVKATPSNKPGEERPGDADLLRRTREAVQANASAIMGKAPDLVKGEGIAFKSIKGADLAGFTDDTANAFASYVGKLAASTEPQDQADLLTAINGFNGAAIDIASSPELQGNQSAIAGVALKKALSSLPPQVTAQMQVGIAHFGADGKIR